MAPARRGGQSGGDGVQCGATFKGLFMAKSKSSASKATTKTTTKSKSTAKSKSKTTTERKAPVKKTTTKSAAKTAAKKPVAKRAPAAPAGMPMIDTNLAAQAAASMLINRETIESAEAAPPSAKESGAFKNFKEQIAKPKPASLSNIFGPATDLKKSGGHFNINQQKGHGQTFGGLNKGVPRRTNG
jgi:hypothetical protein